MDTDTGDHKHVFLVVPVGRDAAVYREGGPYTRTWASACPLGCPIAQLASQEWLGMTPTTSGGKGSPARLIPSRHDSPESPSTLELPFPTEESKTTKKAGPSIL